eukprot:TRINITY_DN62045_c0_g1_i1.p1 TRINITY_DN62045_c0_g1~~TRINITY_DN62045_c0_g1_i1.p1  ORF type:complete len:1188 (+),score=207.45 TRINITY_DN62045_c0_g1_i1:300-3566(+)
MGEQHLTNIWIGGTLDGELKLGWIMQNVVSLCAKYAKKKTGGRFFLDMGGKSSPSQMGFPLRTLFTFCRTPADERPPKLGSQELNSLAWPGPGLLEVDTTSTYTLIWKSPYLDLCSWDLLKVPGVSPLPLESVLGDINSARVFIYDLGKAGGSHANYRDGLILESHFVRGSEGDQWPEEPEGLQEADDEQGEDGAKTPLAVSDASSEEEEASLAGSENEDCVTERGDQSSSDSSADSADDEAIDEQEEEELRELNRKHSEALFQIESWRPRQMDGVDARSLEVQVPFYIEAIDRRRKRKVRNWYVFAMPTPEGDGVWSAKDASELASLCRPKRRLQTFRRGPGARRFTACAVKTLETFRSVINEQLADDTKLRRAVLTAAANGAVTPPAENAGGDALTPGPPSPKHMSPARLARKVKRRAMGSKVALMPPRFFVAADSVTCGLAFAHARPGRGDATHEALVGSVHFEGRLCEELMRLSADGVLRCFTPYDCEKPRINIHVTEILYVEAMPGLFLRRFFVWQVHTFLRVFSFCCAESHERDQWVTALQEAVKRFSAEPQGAGSPPSGPAADPLTSSKTPSTSAALVNETSPVSSIATPTPTLTPTPSIAAKTPGSKGHSGDAGFSFKSAKEAAGRVAGGAVSGIRAIAGGKSVQSREAALLLDSSRARRWGKRRRMVLNDRILVSAPSQPLSPDIAGRVLEKVLSLGEKPAMSDVTAFFDATCLFKAVSLASWSEGQLLAFWLNVYHCMLVHGYLIFGTPKTKSEMKNFRNRVSYLIGPRPMSLREIESVILRVPRVEPQAAGQVRARARQFFAFCGCCRRRPRESDQPFQRRLNSAGKIVSPTGQAADRARAHLDQEGNLHREEQRNTRELNEVVTHLCLPKMPISTPWHHEKPSACLYLGTPHDIWPRMKQDLRIPLVLNGGTLCSLSAIPVFSAAALDHQLNDMAHQFVSTFVEVQLQDGRPQRVTLPMCCRGILKELSDKQDNLLQFIWRFMGEEAKPLLPDQKVQVKFKKYPEDPRQRTQFFRAIFSDPSLQQKSAAEFDVVHGTAQALAATFAKDSQLAPQLLGPAPLARSVVHLKGRTLVSL